MYVTYFANYEASHTFKVSFLTHAVTTAYETYRRQRSLRAAGMWRADSEDSTDVEILLKEELVGYAGETEIKVPGDLGREVTVETITHGRELKATITHPREARAAIHLHFVKNETLISAIALRSVHGLKDKQNPCLLLGSSTLSPFVCPCVTFFILTQLGHQML